MKQPITENEEKKYWGKKCPGVSSDLKLNNTIWGIITDCYMNPIKYLL